LNLRLTSKTWRAAIPACKASQTLHLLPTSCWKFSARQIRQISPHSSIVINADGETDLSPLLGSTGYDKLNIAPWPGLMSQWTLQPVDDVSNKVKRSVLQLQAIQKLCGDHLNCS